MLFIIFFCRHKIKRRTPRENNLIQFKKKKPSFKIKNRLSLNDEKLKIAGIMLYCAEGSKWKGETIVDFANGDPMMIKTFLDFLRKVCKINEVKLRIYLYCYVNQNPQKLIAFWSKLTKISAKQFTKSYVRKDFQESKSGKMKYGLIHIRYYDKKLFLLIMEWIDEFVRERISEGTKVVKWA